MQASIEKIKLSFKNLLSKKVSYKKKSIRPGKHWRILLLMTQVFVVLLGLLSFYYYNEINNGRLYVVEDEVLGGDVKINTELLKKVVDEMTSKEESLSEIIIGKFVPPDPSL